MSDPSLRLGYLLQSLSPRVGPHLLVSLVYTFAYWTSQRLSWPFLTSPVILQVLWTFSIYLEAVAILPQLVLLQRTKNVDNLTGQYIFFLG